MYSFRQRARSALWPTRYAESCTVTAKAMAQEKQGERVRRVRAVREMRRLVIASAAVRAEVVLVWVSVGEGRGVDVDVDLERSVAHIVWRGEVVRVERGRWRRMEAKFIVIWAQDMSSSGLLSVDVFGFGVGTERR